MTLVEHFSTLSILRHDGTDTGGAARSGQPVIRRHPACHARAARAQAQRGTSAISLAYRIIIRSLLSCPDPAAGSHHARGLRPRSRHVGEDPRRSDRAPVRGARCRDHRGAHGRTQGTSESTFCTNDLSRDTFEPGGRPQNEPCHCTKRTQHRWGGVRRHRPGAGGTAWTGRRRSSMGSGERAGCQDHTTSPSSTSRARAGRSIHP